MGVTVGNKQSTNTSSAPLQTDEATQTPKIKQMLKIKRTLLLISHCIMVMSRCMGLGTLQECEDD